MNNDCLKEAEQQLDTLLDMIRWGMSQFHAAKLYYGHGTDNAWDEALALCLHALHLPLDSRPQILDARLTLTEKKAILAHYQQRITTRVPAAYITKEAWFCGLPFYVDDRVLVPRSPMAELIEQGFEPWLEPDTISNVLDLCTGSGCIAIACAMALPDANVDAVDISDAALSVATINCEKHQLSDQVQLIQSDVFNAVPQKQYDVIISNPPYVSADEMADVPEEYYQEPYLLALQADDDGLAIVIRILQQALDYLTVQGVLIVEVGNTAEALVNRYPQIPFTWLEFEHGGDGVFLLTEEQLKQHQADFVS